MRSVLCFCVPSFCALLEQKCRPETAGKPVVVVHRSSGGEFVISASPEAKAQGVRDGMMSRHAERYCPAAKFVHADRMLYNEASRTMLDILAEYSPLLEPQGTDTSYLDLTGCSSIFGSLESAASQAAERISDTLGMPVAVGIAGNKLLAGIAASACRPGSMVKVEPGTERDFLSAVPVGQLPGVGWKTEKRLIVLGVRTVGELAAIPERLLVRQFGPAGSRMHRLAHGIDHSPVQASYPPETVVDQHIFDNQPSEPDEISPTLLLMCERSAERLRRRNRISGRVTLTLEYADRGSTGRTHTLKSPTAATPDIYNAAKRILMMEANGLRVSSIRLVLSEITPAGGMQLSLLDNPERRMRLQSLFSAVNSRFGDRSLMYGSTLYRHCSFI